MDLTPLLAAHRAGELDLERFCAVLIERLRQDPAELAAMSDRIRALADSAEVTQPTRRALARLLGAAAPAADDDLPEPEVSDDPTTALQQAPEPLTADADLEDVDEAEVEVANDRTPVPPQPPEPTLAAADADPADAGIADTPVVDDPTTVLSGPPEPTATLADADLVDTEVAGIAVANDRATVPPSALEPAAALADADLLDTGTAATPVADDPTTILPQPPEPTATGAAATPGFALLSEPSLPVGTDPPEPAAPAPDSEDRTVVAPPPANHAGLSEPLDDKTVVAPPRPRRRSWRPITETDPAPPPTAGPPTAGPPTAGPPTAGPPTAGPPNPEPPAPEPPEEKAATPAPERQPESSPEDRPALKAKVEDAFLTHYLDGYRTVGKQDRTPEGSADKQLDQMLGSLKGVRDRRTARRVADGERLAPRLAGTGTRTPLKVGAVLKNRFVLEKELGAGGMGTVFRAVDRRKLEAGSEEPYVAIKLLNEELRTDAEAVRALEREARRTQTLSHPNIINVFDFDRDGRHVYITMEFLDGRPLDRIIRRQYGSPPVDRKGTLGMITGIGRALAYAHDQNFVHADVKPSNVFRLKSNSVKVLDFGLAAAVGPPGTGLAEGEDGLSGLTPSYASPERLRGDPPTREDDIYALGCVAYILLSGQHPFQRTPADKAQIDGMTVPPIPTLKPDQMAALRAALAFDPKTRCPSVGDLVAGLCGERIGDGS